MSRLNPFDDPFELGQNPEPWEPSPKEKFAAEIAFIFDNNDALLKELARQAVQNGVKAHNCGNPQCAYGKFVREAVAAARQNAVDPQALKTALMEVLEDTGVQANLAQAFTNGQLWADQIRAQQAAQETRRAELLAEMQAVEKAWNAPDLRAIRWLQSHEQALEYWWRYRRPRPVSWLKNLWWDFLIWLEFGPFESQYSWLFDEGDWTWDDDKHHNGHYPPSRWSTFKANPLGTIKAAVSRKPAGPTDSKK